MSAKVSINSSIWWLKMLPNSVYLIMSLLSSLFLYCTFVYVTQTKGCKVTFGIMTMVPLTESLCQSYFSFAFYFRSFFPSKQTLWHLDLATHTVNPSFPPPIINIDIPCPLHIEHVKVYILFICNCLRTQSYFLPVW